MSIAFKSSRGRFSFQLADTSLGQIGVAALQQASDGGYVARVEPTRTCFILEMPLLGRSRLRTAGEQFDVAAGKTLAIISPNQAAE